MVTPCESTRPLVQSPGTGAQGQGGSGTGAQGQGGSGTGGLRDRGSGTGGLRDRGAQGHGGSGTGAQGQGGSGTGGLRDRGAHPLRGSARVDLPPQPLVGGAQCRAGPSVTDGTPDGEATRGTALSVTPGGALPPPPPPRGTGQPVSRLTGPGPRPKHGGSEGEASPNYCGAYQTKSDRDYPVGNVLFGRGSAATARPSGRNGGCWSGLHESPTSTRQRGDLMHAQCPLGTSGQEPNVSAH